MPVCAVPALPMVLAVCRNGQDLRMENLESNGYRGKEMKCPICKRKFPAGLIADAFVGGKSVTMCPLCYGDDHLRRHKVEWNPVGEIASEMFEEAKQLYPDWRPK